MLTYDDKYNAKSKIVKLIVGITQICHREEGDAGEWVSAFTISLLQVHVCRLIANQSIFVKG